MKKVTIAVLLCIMVVSLASGFVACSKDKVGTPQNITFDEDNNMTWSEVENARGYTVEITNHTTGEKVEVSPRKPAYNLSELEQGDYDIRIKTLASTRRLQDSDWTETISFYKKYETGLVYTLINNNREYEITRVGRAKGKFTIEDFYRGKPVTRIADGAFRRSRTIEEVVVGENIAYIGASAFTTCTALKKVVLPNTLSQIGESCFLSCSVLEEINIPEALRVINNNTFQYCRSLDNVVFTGSNLTTISEFAFDSCSSLKEIAIPDSVTEIARYAFNACTSLKKVSIGSGVQAISEYAFSRCDLTDGVEFSENSSLLYIYSYAFSYATGLKGMDIPEGVLQIGSSAFSGSREFGYITIPDSCMYVGAYITYKTKLFTEEEGKTGTDFFYADKWLVGISSDLLKKITSIGGNTSGVTDGKVNIDIRPGTVGIAASTFQYAKQLEEVTIPNSVKYINSYAFRKCEKLWRFNSYTSNLELLDGGVFYECTALNNVRLGQKLKVIGDYCFYKCQQLFMPQKPEDYILLIPDTVYSIGKYAFFNSGIWNQGYSNDGVVYAGNWVVGTNNVSSSITLKEGTVGIADFGLAVLDVDIQAQNPGVSEVKGTESLRYLGRGSFYNCSKLSNFYINQNIKEIPDFCFYGCQSLISVNPPASLERIGRSAFFACQKLLSVDLSNCYKLKSIGTFAFGYTGITSIKLPEYRNIKEIAPYTFYKCTSLQEITIPVGVEKIGAYAFTGDEALTKVTFNQDKAADESQNYGLFTSINDYAFYQCYNLAEINVPDSISTIGNSAFYGAVALEEFNFSNNITSIGDNAFCGAVMLQSVSLSNNLQYLGMHAFNGCDGLTSVTLSKDVYLIGAYAFYQSSYITIYTDHQEKPIDWHARWNASYRPVVWGATLSEDGSYVVSMTVDEKYLENVNEYMTTTNPTRAGYIFKGWSKVEGSIQVDFASFMDEGIPKGTVLYAVWESAVDIPVDDEPENPTTPDPDVA